MAYASDRKLITDTETTRDQILQAFLAAPGKFLSGTALSQQVGVSRTAIWKHVQALERLGFAFEAQPRIGHRITRIPDLLLPPVLKSKIPAHQALGRHTLWYPEVDSTNRVASDLVRQGIDHGAVITAMRQTGGRGRRGKAWFSPVGGLWMSVVWRLPVPIRQAAEFTLLTSIAVRRAIQRQVQLPVQIKWPNDLLVHGRKVTGILAEIRADGEVVQSAVIGVGINTNIPAAAFPPELAPLATSLSAEAGRELSNVQLAADILSELQVLLDDLVAHGRAFASVLDEWKTASATLGRAVRVQTPHGILEGFAETIDEAGVLYLRTEQGTRVAIHSGEVLF